MQISIINRPSRYSCIVHIDVVMVRILLETHLRPRYPVVTINKSAALSTYTVYMSAQVTG